MESKLEVSHLTVQLKEQFEVFKKEKKDLEDKLKMISNDRGVYERMEKVRMANFALKSLLGEMKRLIPEEQDLRKECVSVIHEYLKEKEQK